MYVHTNEFIIYLYMYTIMDLYMQNVISCHTISACTSVRIIAQAKRPDYIYTYACAFCFSIRFRSVNFLSTVSFKI